MRSNEDKALITQADPGTPGGEVARYRGEDGEARIGFHCPHRGADLTSGRLELGGLRCIYHGWGHCLEQPNEPAGSSWATAYPWR